MRIGNIEITADEGLSIAAKVTPTGDNELVQVHVSRKDVSTHPEWVVTALDEGGVSHVLYFGRDETEATKAFDEALSRFPKVLKQKAEVADAFTAPVQRD